MKPEQCKDCKYFRTLENTPNPNDGKCRRYPPVLIYVGRQLITEFPVVNAFQWCGEWETK